MGVGGRGKGFFLFGVCLFVFKVILGRVQGKNASCLTEQSTDLSSLLSREKRMCAMSLLPLLLIFSSVCGTGSQKRGTGQPFSRHPRRRMHRSIVWSRSQHIVSNSLHLQRDFYGSCHYSSRAPAKYAYLCIITQDNQGDLLTITTETETQLLIRTVKEFKTNF